MKGLMSVKKQLKGEIAAQKIFEQVISEIISHQSTVLIPIFYKLARGKIHEWFFLEPLVPHQKLRILGL